MKNNRKIERIHLVDYLHVLDSSNDRLVGYLLDIHLHGLMLAGLEPIKADSLFHLKVMLPEDIQGKSHFPIEASCRWCKKNSKEDWYDIGFKIIQIAREDIEIVRTFLPDSYF
ncbi:MAG: PilZ domain-containing protein [Candidatus Aureabacteria bacterium]|nr:PilZ domain-containing protein [Candidatus Auribacterota bacterium]